MRRTLMLLFAALAWPSLASAMTVVVPQDFTTIQPAIDSGADTIIVGSGYFDPVLNVSRSVVILPADYGSGHVVGSHYPEVGRVNVTLLSRGLQILRGMHIRGSVSIKHNANYTSDFRLEQCLVDSSFTARTYSTIRCNGNIFRGKVDVTSAYTDFSMNTVIHASVFVHADEGTILVRGNEVWGPAPYGLSVSTGSSVVVLDNHVVGTTDGILTIDEGTVSRNVVEDCPGTGFKATTGVKMQGNIARRCGVGMDLSAGHYGGYYVLTGNLIDRAIGDGIRIVTRSYASLDSNIVRRCGGDAITSTMTDPGQTDVHHNTIYANGGTAITINANYHYRYTQHDVHHNIAYRNGGFGLKVVDGDVLPSCNDWFENVAGATEGIAPGATDLAVDPQFCNADADSVALRAGSSLLDAPGCGRIGALGLGCGDVSTAVLLEMFDLRWLEGAVEARWEVGAEVDPASVTLERALEENGPWTVVHATRATDASGTVVSDADVTSDVFYWYRLRGVTLSGEALVLGTATVTTGEPIRELALSRPVPNPALRDVRVDFAVPTESRVRLRVFDVQGREVAKIVDARYRPGRYSSTWNASSGGSTVASGIYFLRLDSNHRTVTRRLVLQR